MEGGRRWCNTCSIMVNPTREVENKCPACGSEFTEVIMESLRLSSDHNEEGSILFRSASVFSLYAPILLGLMSSLRSALAAINNNNNGSSSREEEDDEQEMEHQHGDLVVRRRRRRRRTSSTSLVLIFRRLHDRLPESDRNTNNTENNQRNNNGGRYGDNNNMNLNVVVVDPLNEEALILIAASPMGNARSNAPMGSLGDFLDGPRFGLLLQHLAQNSNNEVNRYVNRVNPPAQKAAIEAMTTVTTEENMACIICLEEAEIGSEVKEMPCGHKFHGDCIISWLKLRSSCPVCRFQMPSDDNSKVEANDGRQNEGDLSNDQVMRRQRRLSLGRWNWLSILQPFDFFLPSP